MSSSRRSSAVSVCSGFSDGSGLSAPSSFGTAKYTPGAFKNFPVSSSGQNSQTTGSWRSVRPWSNSTPPSSQASTPSSSPPTSGWSSPTKLPSPPAGKPNSLMVGNWRTPLPPAISSTQEWDDLEEGQVFLLPEELQIDASSIIFAALRAQGRTDKPFGHPCVVVSKKIENGVKVVEILGLTAYSTSGAKGIPSHKTPRDESRMTLCANDDASVKPHNGVLEVKTGSCRFKKATYLNYFGQHHPLSIEFDQLQTWTTKNRRPIQFTAAAVATIKRQHALVQRGGLIPPK